MRFPLLLLVTLLAPLAHAEPATHLTQPARRVVSLSPHITENLFVIGAGNRVVGTVEFSNYPEEAKQIRQIGSYEKIDLEAVAALRPDLVIAWESGNIASHVARLKAIGLNVVVTEARRIEDVPADLERLGGLSGTGTG
ncbi:MAG: helical backbone metal receptor, partial [Rhodocyclaceae bacterium]|nr:helical backbone metal receptor [Rhodocyclaceae bacterium]